MILCIAEKPSVAREIARVIKADGKKGQGYLEGNGYIVTWAVGHLITLAEPEAYGYVSQKEMFGERAQEAYAELPLVPDKFKLVVIESTKDQYEVVKTLMHREDVEYIIDCGDMGAEGHILQWFIRQKAGCKKPVKRFCATSMTDEAIRHAMNNLRTEEEFMPVIRGEFCKKKADWIMGMSMSRAETIKYKKGINVGRVQSPTLGFVVKRYIAVENFHVTDYFVIEASLSNGAPFRAVWKKDDEGRIRASDKDEEGRLLNSAVAEKLAKEVEQGKEGTVISYEVVKKATNRPQLYDITELQRDANRRYGYTAAETLTCAQILYERYKVLSYPRTDSRYITSDIVPLLKTRVIELSNIEPYRASAQRVIEIGLNIDNIICDDKKVTDHHALIPTENIKGFDIKSISASSKDGVTTEALRNVLNLVLCRLIVSLSTPYKYEQTKAVIQMKNGMKFQSGGIRPIEKGWKEIQEKLFGKDDNEQDDAEEKEDTQEIPLLQKGQTVDVTKCDSISKKTSPPKLHTEATLLTAMENAGASIENGAILKGKGIGTQATRAEIIKKLFDTGVIEALKKGKTNYLIPTAKGLSVIRILPPEIYSPKITADWETKIAEIVAHKTTEEEFMRDFIAFIREKINEVKTVETGVSFQTEKKTCGNCPWCGEPVYLYTKREGRRTQKLYYCSQRSCGWKLSLDDKTVIQRTKKPLTEAEALSFIANKILVKRCTAANGKTYKGQFSFVKKEKDGKTYCNVGCAML
ncbi:MAG: DNA topoisomerase [Clostridia bacterium]|nr:DNA topoisomerase [Clostridia bacterium]